MSVKLTTIPEVASDREGIVKCSWQLDHAGWVGVGVDWVLLSSCIDQSLPCMTTGVGTSSLIPDNGGQ